MPNATGSKRSVAMRHRAGATPNGRTDWAALRAANNRAMAGGAMGSDDPDVDPLTNALHMATMLGVDLPPPPTEWRGGDAALYFAEFWRRRGATVGLAQPCEPRLACGPSSSRSHRPGAVPTAHHAE